MSDKYQRNHDNHVRQSLYSRRHRLGTMMISFLLTCRCWTVAESSSPSTTPTFTPPHRGLQQPGDQTTAGGLNRNTTTEAVTSSNNTSVQQPVKRKKKKKVRRYDGDDETLHQPRKKKKVRRYDVDEEETPPQSPAPQSTRYHNEPPNKRLLDLLLQNLEGQTTTWAFSEEIAHSGSASLSKTFVRQSIVRTFQRPSLGDVSVVVPDSNKNTTDSLDETDESPHVVVTQLRRREEVLVDKNDKKTVVRKRARTTTTTTTTSRRKETATLGGREGSLLRRIKQEWRDAVKMGIAYDWKKAETIKRAATSQHDYVRIGPWGKNLLQWHFSVQGPAHSVYENGVYHGRVLLPKDYPCSPPRIQVLTPSGRFIPGHDICLSASHFHPESWTPQWTVLSLVDALRLHMLTTANEIGGKDCPSDERRKLALASRTWGFDRVNHEYMTRAGIFPLLIESNEATTSTKETKPQKSETNVTASFDSQHERGNVDDDVLDLDEEFGSAVRAEAESPTMQQALTRKRRRKSGWVPILFESAVKVLTSAPRLVGLILLAVFIILNSH